MPAIQQLGDMSGNAGKAQQMQQMLSAMGIMQQGVASQQQNELGQQQLKQNAEQAMEQTRQFNETMSTQADRWGADQGMKIMAYAAQIYGQNPQLGNKLFNIGIKNSKLDIGDLSLQELTDSPMYGDYVAKLKTVFRDTPKKDISTILEEMDVPSGDWKEKLIDKWADWQSNVQVAEARGQALANSKLAEQRTKTQIEMDDALLAPEGSDKNNKAILYHTNKAGLGKAGKEAVPGATTEVLDDASANIKAIDSKLATIRSDRNYGSEAFGGELKVQEKTLEAERAVFVKRANQSRIDIASVKIQAYNQAIARAKAQGDEAMAERLQQRAIELYKKTLEQVETLGGI